MRKTICELRALINKYEKCYLKRLSTTSNGDSKVGKIPINNRNRLMLKARVKEKARKRIKVISLSLKTLNLLLKSTQQRMTSVTTTKRWGIVFKNEVENQLGKTIKALRSDRGGEYISQEFKDYLKACGIVQQLTPPYTPQHNGVSERRNRTLLDMVRSMMNLTTLPLSFWDYALESAARILNMVPTKKVDKTPYELWFGKVPNLSYLKVWGCEALVKRDTPDKLQQRSVKCIFIGYPKETMGYYFYFPPENKIVVASQIPMEVEGFEPPQEEEAHVRRSKRPHRAPNRLCLNVEVEEHSSGDLNEPANYKAAMLDPEPNKWLDAMNADMQSIKDNQV
ncbi:retrotransposon protein, putative, ty1-copia subclass [Tanacetum coccineum]